MFVRPPRTSAVAKEQIGARSIRILNLYRCQSRLYTRFKKLGVEVVALATEPAGAEVLSPYAPSIRN